MGVPTSWSVQAYEDGAWRDVPESGPRLSTAHRVWRGRRLNGQRARIMLNGRPVRMTSTSEQLDLDLEQE